LFNVQRVYKFRQENTSSYGGRKGGRLRIKGGEER